MLLETGDRVARTRGFEAAYRTEQRRKSALVEAQKRDEEAGDHRCVLARVPDPAPETCVAPRLCASASLERRRRAIAAKALDAIASHRAADLATHDETDAGPLAYGLRVAP